MSDLPKEYQRGWVEFYKLKFAINQHVLIPRPETELLVDQVLDFVRHSPADHLTILDVGTGAGAITIALALNLPKTKKYRLVATDISPEALEIAKKNAQLHGATQITFLESDLLKNPELTQLQPDIIVTNLPYIPSERIVYLDASVKDYEPWVALDGGHDGFELYRQLFTEIKQFGWQPQLFVGEIDYTHAEIAIHQAQQFFPQAEAHTQLDLYHRQRILLIAAPKSAKTDPDQQPK